MHELHGLLDVLFLLHHMPTNKKYKYNSSVAGGIPDSDFYIPDLGPGSGGAKKAPDRGSQIRIRNNELTKNVPYVSILNPELLISSRKYHTGCLFRIPNPDFSIPVPDPGVKKHWKNTT
jgi:hypothetical protein